MEHTVIGIFENSTAANEAARKLHSEGFHENKVDTAWSHTDSYTRADKGSETPYSVNDESRYDHGGRNPQRDVLNEDRIDERKGRREFDAGEGDSIGRFFRNLFDNREEAEKFASAGRSNPIVSVHAASAEEARKAAEILDACGALDVNEQSGNPNTYTRAERPAPDQTTSGSSGKAEASANEERNPQRETIRVRSRIIEKPVGENLRLREEHMYIEKGPVGNSEETQADEEQGNKSGGI